jgi:hypothetical protein
MADQKDVLYWRTLFSKSSPEEFVPMLLKLLSDSSFNALNGIAVIEDIANQNPMTEEDRIILKGFSNTTNKEVLRMRSILSAAWEYLRQSRPQ